MSLAFPGMVRQPKQSSYFDSKVWFCAELKQNTPVAMTPFIPYGLVSLYTSASHLLEEMSANNDDFSFQGCGGSCRIFTHTKYDGFTLEKLHCQKSSTYQSTFDLCLNKQDYRITTLIQPRSPIFTKLFLFLVRIWPIIAQGFNNLARVFWRVGVHSFADICMSLALQTCKLESLPLSRCLNLPHTVSLCRAL